MATSRRVRAVTPLKPKYSTRNKTIPSTANPKPTEANLRMRLGEGVWLMEGVSRELDWVEMGSIVPRETPPAKGKKVKVTNWLPSHETELGLDALRLKSTRIGREVL
jgi:hypothetical protein